MIRVHETGLRRGGGHSEQTESSVCGPLPAYGGLSEDRLRKDHAESGNQHRSQDCIEL